MEDYYVTLEKIINKNDFIYVSFDIFDTLISRDVYNPTDIFRFLNIDFCQYVGATNYIDFSNIREEAERYTREVLCNENVGWQDITLDEIYHYISIMYGIDMDILACIERCELDIEKFICHARSVGKELFELAKKSGKKVICISDMYLPKNFLRQLLFDCGYDGIEEIYVSSEIRLTKYHGDLFDYVQEQVGSDKKIIHIGDNYQSDVVNARKHGFDAYYLPKATDMMFGDGLLPYKGNLLKKIYQAKTVPVCSCISIDSSTAIRTMLAVVANKIYDNPFEKFDKKTDLNANPYYMGYFPVGMHIFSLVEWIREKAIERGYKRIHFLGRDGYIPLEAYKILYDEEKDIDVIYTPMSRSLVFLADIATPIDILAIADKFLIKDKTPQSVIELFKDVIAEREYSAREELCNANDLEYNKKIGTSEKAYKLMNMLAYKMIDFQLLAMVRDKYKKYFQGIFQPGDCIFDMGYNGRVESALTTLLGFKINALYLHVDKEIAFGRAKYNGLKIDSYYEYVPVITFLVREQFASKLSPSVIGLDISGETPKLIYGEDDISDEERVITSQLQEGILDFIADFSKTYKLFKSSLGYKRMDASLPLEVFLNESEDRDRKIFKVVEFEDNFGVGRKFNLYTYWNEMLRSKNKNVDKVNRSIKLHLWLSRTKRAIRESCYLGEQIIRKYEQAKGWL